MSKLKAWHVLVPTVILMVAAPVLGYFLKVKPSVEQVTSMQEEIRQEYEVAARAQIAQAELDRAIAEAANVENELNALKTQRIPLGSGNPWWRSVRAGTAFTPGGGTFRMGPQDQVVELADGMPAMFDVFFELREDLGPALRQYFDSTGVAVSNFSLPAPEFNTIVRAVDLLMPVPLTPTGLTTAGVPGIRGQAQGGAGAMTVQGRYEDVLRFLRRAGNAPRLLRIDGPITMSAVPGTGGKEVSATMRMTVYLLPNLPPDQLSELASLAGQLGAAAAGGGGAMGGMMGPGMPGMMMGPMMGGGASGGGASVPPAAAGGGATSAGGGTGASGG